MARPCDLGIVMVGLYHSFLIFYQPINKADECMLYISQVLACFKLHSINIILFLWNLFVFLIEVNLKSLD